MGSRDAESTSNGDSNGKSDSEAETIVLPGKEAPAGDMRKAIKHEENSEAWRDAVAKAADGDDHSVDMLGNLDPRDNQNKPSLKRKRSAQDSGVGILEAGNSSNLSSTISSPALEAQSSKKGDSDSCRSRSSPPYDEAPHQKAGRTRKHTLESNPQDGGRVLRRTRDPSSDDPSRRERRETRSVNRHEPSHDRSESPSRLQIHSVISNPHRSHKRRKIPPPLLVGNKRKVSEETHVDSDDSGSAHGHSHLRKFTSADHAAVSPAKMPPHKKNRDKNGRTWLARACATGEVETAALRLKERPEDLNVPDYAGNTPLQIASLEGNAKTVQILLDAACDTHCKNIDMETPLMDAVENGHLDVVNLLLRAGLDPRQSNAKGEEPLDLADPDDSDFEAIRTVLITAKEKDTRRRSSADHGQHSAGTKDNDISSRDASAASPRDSPALHSARSPPASALMPRRRMARSQATRDELLWISPTAENLRDRAGKGDLDVVNHILNMRPKADTESVLAAAKGGHEVVLQLLIAIGKPDPDPAPSQSSAYKPAYSTPMLAAIGRENIKVIELLLEQPGFDPTRRLYRGLTYFELAKERQGSLWQEEYKILKEGFDNYGGRGNKAPNHGSPRKSRRRGSDSKTSTPDDSLSPLTTAKMESVHPSANETLQKDKHNSIQKMSVHKHLRLPEPTSRESSLAVSDRESEPLGPPKPRTKSFRSVSDAGSTVIRGGENLKPKRKLLSRNDLKSDQDTRRRASVASVASEPSSTSSQDQPKIESGDNFKTTKIRRERSNESATARSEPGKKRSRVSSSPRGSATDLKESPNTLKKKKRRIVESGDNRIKEDPNKTIPRGSALVANMIAAPESYASPSKPPGAAPVAFMGHPVTSLPKLSSSDAQLPIDPSLKYPSAAQDLKPVQSLPHAQLQSQAGEDVLFKEKLDQENEQHALNDAIARQEHEQAEAEKRKQVQAAREEVERKARLAREEEEARLEEQRRVEDIQRQARIAQEEEEARVEKKRREDEMQRRRIELERLRKEEHERRRTELEERERVRRLWAQEELERQRRESLPNSLRRAAELSPDEAKNVNEVSKWLPLYTATTRDLDPDCDEQIADERWIPNLQAAPVLAIKDLDLSQYTAWPRRIATENQRGSLWRVCRVKLAQASKPSPLKFSHAEAFALDAETRVKFLAMKQVFWIKLSDFTDIVPRHQHLASLHLGTTPMAIMDDPFGTHGDFDKPKPNGFHSPSIQPTSSPNATNAPLTNGHH
ncbi:Set3 complex subunit with deacetylase activity, meiotic-specific repressor of sporulation proteins [Toensbergia leucococca]|nr:Set3 complex subunit with deacetylase activity, meiotic-specific repressor of sporulation proteins [Toensbergia leucococca]